jgi:hypothetical protein
LCCAGRLTASDLEKSAMDETPEEDDDKLPGLFSDVPELTDQITEWAMKSRVILDVRK